MRARRPPLIVTEAAARRLIAELPVSALRDRLVGSRAWSRASDDTRGRESEEASCIDSLQRLGIRTLGELAALPAEAVADRFGEPGLKALRLARGADEPLRPRQPHEELACHLSLPEAASGQQLERALELLIERLARPPARARRTFRRLRLEAHLAGGGGWRRDVAMRSASSSAERLKLALAPRLGELPGPADRLGLRAVELGAQEGDQAPLAPSPEDERRGRLAEAVRQARAAAGRDAVLQVIEVDPALSGARTSRDPDPVRCEIDAELSRMSLYWPTPVEVETNADGVPSLDRRRDRRNGARAVACRGSLVDAKAPAKTLLRGDLGQRSQHRRLPRARGPTRARALVRATRMTYVELHAHSAYSFLDGVSQPAELAGAAAELGYPAMALTDHDNVCGAMEFAQACKPLGVRPIAGAELAIAGGSHVTVLVESATGWANLCRLLTEAHAETRPRLDRDPLPPSLTLESLLRAKRGTRLPLGLCRRRCRGRALGARPATARRKRLRGDCLTLSGANAFGSSCSAHSGAATALATTGLRTWRAHLGVATVATGNVHSHTRGRAALQDAFVAVRMHTTLEECEPARRGNSSSVLASPAEMAARFAEHPDAVAETERLAERLRFDLASELGYRYPGSEDPEADNTLAEICRGRFELRYDGTPERREAERCLDEELRVIRGLGLSGFFLLHFDLLELARDVAAEVRGPDSARQLMPPGRGRGSSVSSVVCYLTGLSHVDPVKAGLFLGRFLNDEISDMPDIDLDFPRDIREKLIPRVHERYGRERAALVSAFACYRSRGAVRDLGKALGLPPGEIERVAQIADVYARGDEIERDIAEAIGAGRAASPRWRHLADLAREAWGLPRHISQHPGGMVLSTRPLTSLCPVQPAAMEGRQIVQWDKDSCADAGFLKIDLLGLGMLSAVERAVDLHRRGPRRAHRSLADRARRPADVRGDPGGRDHRRLSDRKPSADADAAAKPSRDARRRRRPGGAGAPGPDPGRRRASLSGAPKAAARGPRPIRSPTSIRAWSRSSRTRSVRSSSRTR